MGPESPPPPARRSGEAPERAIIYTHYKQVPENRYPALAQAGGAEVICGADLSLHRALACQARAGAQEGASMEVLTAVDVR